MPKYSFPVYSGSVDVDTDKETIAIGGVEYSFSDIRKISWEEHYDDNHGYYEGKLEFMLNDVRKPYLRIPTRLGLGEAKELHGSLAVALDL